MTLPNFLVTGAAKSGTTSLYHYLKNHPQIYMSPVKEPEFFTFMGQPVDRGDYRLAPANFAVTDRSEYEKLFKDVRDELAIGEASPGYIYSQEAAHRIKAILPGAKLIAILRDPAERAYSHFNMRRNKSSANVAEPIKDFEAVLAAEEQRIREGWGPGWHYKRRGFYYEQLRVYYDLFDRSRIRVYLYEDLRTDPSGLLRDLFRFLNVDPAWMPDGTRVHNKGAYNAVVKNKAWHSFLTGENWVKKAVKPLLARETRTKMKKFLIAFNRGKDPRKDPALDPETRRRLVAAYREDILKLQDLIGRDLSPWLK